MTLAVGILIAGLTIVAWTQPWFEVTLVDDAPAVGSLPVGGEVAAGGLAGLGLAGLALVGALSIAGRVFRLILGVLQVLIGATIVLSTVVALLDPVGAASAAVTEVTGESGERSLRALVESASIGFWPYAAAVLGVGAVALGVVVLATSSRWPGSSRRYQAARFEPDTSAGPSTRPTASTTPEDVAPEPGGVDRTDDAVSPGAVAPDAIADWDALSDGSDPTSR